VTYFEHKLTNKALNRLTLLLSFLFVFANCNSQPKTGGPIEDQTTDEKIMVGAAQFDRYLPILLDKRVGLVVNQTSKVANSHLVDTLLSKGVAINKVFAPEHGFRGDADAGATIEDGIDKKSQLPIISLYGSNKKPTSEQLSDLDVIVFDIQDVGTRFYTYISTMHYVMEAAAENQKEVLILDRPNPNGMYVAGPVLDMELQSFVGMHPIPIVHGLTVGELAKMIVGEGWLSTPNRLNYDVIKCLNYDHSMSYSLPVKPSPNLPNDLSIKLYPSLCLFEGTVVSVGRGTKMPFQQIGHPSFIDLKYQFTPESIEGMASNPKYKNQACYGLKFERHDHHFTLEYLIDFYNRYEGDDFFNSYFNKLAGNKTLQEQIKAGLRAKEVTTSWEEELNAYREIRKKYLLYPDFE